MTRLPLLLILTAVAQTVSADDTALDPAFGLGGRYNNSPSYFTKTLAHLPRPGGGSVAVTHDHDVDINNNASGPDTIGLKLFNDAGAFIAGFGAPANISFSQIGGAAIDSLGRIVVVGSVYFVGGNYDFRVVRLLPDGAPDTSFSGDGVADIAFELGGSHNDYANAVAIDALNRIVVVGQVQRATAGDTDFGIIRLLTNGTLDNTFSGDGKEVVLFDLGATLRSDAARAVVIGSDGRITIGGSALDGNLNVTRIGLAKFTNAGVPDFGFCPGACNFMGSYTGVHSGRRVIFYGSDVPALSDSLDAMSINDDGELVTAGTTPGTGETLGYLQKFDSAGNWLAERTTQGAFGGNVYIGGVHWQDPVASNGNIVLTGTSGPNEEFFFAQRFGPTFAPSSNWGGVGPSNSVYVWTASGGFGDAGDNRPAASTIDPSGRVLVGGGFKTSSNSTYRSTISRLTYTGPPLGVFFKDSFE